jgi:hypothetical protein
MGVFAGGFAKVDGFCVVLRGEFVVIAWFFVVACDTFFDA